MMQVRVANLEDHQRLEQVFKAHCSRMNLQWSNFEPVAKKILSHIDFGLVLLAEDSEQTVHGFMMFTYEWSDWRDGLFFWVQGVEGDDFALKEMKTFLD
jgi:hypothetical protein